MMNKIAQVSAGQPDNVGEFNVSRLIPNRYTESVGPFVFLDHLPPAVKPARKPVLPDGSHAHPHRGIATFSYVLSGELQHYDSMGNYGVVSAGGAQWMKAGNGIIHDEGLSPNFQQEGGILHSLQFWVNLPAKNKAETPAYIQVNPEEVPMILLPSDAGTLRILIGEYEGSVSKVETYSPQYMYEINLKPGAEFTLKTEPGWEHGVFIPEGEALINGQLITTGELATMENGTEFLQLKSTADTQTTILIFGGEHYHEPIVARGPFVMNSFMEIEQAYTDYSSGKYGQIKY